jgi:hypothetical protein
VHAAHDAGLPPQASLVVCSADPVLPLIGTVLMCSCVQGAVHGFVEAAEMQFMLVFSAGALVPAIWYAPSAQLQSYMPYCTSLAAIGRHVCVWHGPACVCCIVIRPLSICSTYNCFNRVQPVVHFDSCGAAAHRSSNCWSYFDQGSPQPLMGLKVWQWELVVHCVSVATCCNAL